MFLRKVFWNLLYRCGSPTGGWHVKILLSMFALCFALNAFAGDELPEEFSSGARSQEIKFSLNVFHFDYAEDLTPPHKSTEYGTLPAVELQYSRTFPNIWLNASFWATQYGITYDGSYGDGTPVTSPTKLEIIEGKAQVGYDFYYLSYDKRFFLTLGLGYHLWNRGEKNPAEGSYRERYSWYFVPFGPRFIWNASDAFRVEGDVLLNIPFGGEIKIFESDLSSDRQDLTLALGSHPGVRVSISPSWENGDNLFFSLTPWFEYSAINKNDADVQYSWVNNSYIITYEPDSRTFLYGLSLSGGLRF